MGKLIVLEGIDGSGKSTQYRRLCRRFETEGRAFRHIVFPRYDKESSALIRLYLGGAFGAKPTDVNAYAASTFYAVDRFAAYKDDWGAYYEAGGLLLSDRYTTSNAIHQGSKLTGQERLDYFAWLRDFEYRLMGLPKPDLVLYMDISADRAAERLRARESATGTRADIHEKDLGYLRACADCAHDAAAYYGWRRVAAFDGDRPRGEEEIEEEIREILLGLL